MSEYTIRGTFAWNMQEGHDIDGFEVVAPDGTVVLSTEILAEAERVANAYNVPILRQEIASLQEAAAEARSEALGETRNFIRDFAEHIIPIDNFGARVDANRQARAYLEFKARAQVLMEQWEAAEVETAE